MGTKFQPSTTRRFRSQRGQGITEYAMVIAFVCTIIAIAFAVSKGTLFAAISNSYSGASSSLGQLNNAALKPM